MKTKTVKHEEAGQKKLPSASMLQALAESSNPLRRFDSIDEMLEYLDNKEHETAPRGA